MKKSAIYLLVFLLLTVLSVPATAANKSLPNQKQQMSKHEAAHIFQQKRSVCIVKKGDNLWKISQRHNVRFAKILTRNNHFKNKNLIYPGNRVYLPPKVETEAPPEKEEKIPPEEPVKEETKQPQQPVKENNISNFETKVVDLVNQERKKLGLKPYKHNQKLAQVARKKSEDMRDNNYFSHQSPTYGSPFEMMRQFNIQYSTAGENIAKGQRTPQEVVNSWMNSPGHRRNILSQEFTEIGVGFAQNKQGETFWTQMFIRP